MASAPKSTTSSTTKRSTKSKPVASAAKSTGPSAAAPAKPAKSTGPSAAAPVKPASKPLAPIFVNPKKRKSEEQGPGNDAASNPSKKRRVEKTSSAAVASSSSAEEVAAKGGGNDEEKNAIVQATNTTNGELLFCLTVFTSFMSTSNIFHVHPYPGKRIVIGTSGRAHPAIKICNEPNCIKLKQDSTEFCREHAKKNIPNYIPTTAPLCITDGCKFLSHANGCCNGCNAKGMPAKFRRKRVKKATATLETSPSHFPERFVLGLHDVEEVFGVTLPPELARIFAELQTSVDDLHVSGFSEEKRRETHGKYNQFITAMPNGTMLPEPPRSVVPAPQTDVYFPLCGIDKIPIPNGFKKKGK